MTFEIKQLILMEYIAKLNTIIGPYHWNEKIEEKFED